MDCYFGGTGPSLWAIPKKFLGGVRDLLGFSQPTFRHQVGRLTLHCVSGQAIGSLWEPLKKGLESKMGGAGVFPVPICPCAGVLVSVQLVSPSLAVPPCHRSSFLEQGRLDYGGRSSLV